MTELEKIAYAKKFLDSLAEGVNPVDGTPVPEGDVARSPRVVGCFRYVSELLETTIQAGGIKRIPRGARAPFSATVEQLMQYRFPPEPRTVSRFVQAVNDTVDLNRVRSLRVRDVTDWLVERGLLVETAAADGRKHRIPTDEGRALGISSSEKTGRDGRYISVAYNQAAQTYLLDHMAEIAAAAAEKDREQEASGDKPSPDEEGSGN